MYEILQHLEPAARVLDIGSREGSFPDTATRAKVVRADLDRPAHPANFVQANASALPFAAASFDAIISNHSLEHFEKLDAALNEWRRILKPNGQIYVAVPDSSTFSDRLYRWLARGGGHVNGFDSLHRLAARLMKTTDLPVAAVRPLHSSLSFSNAKNRTVPAPRKLWLLLNGNETFLLAVTAILRAIDVLFKTRLTVYGWAIYLGEQREPIDETPWRNVCIRCGSAHPSDQLQSDGRVGGIPPFRHYKCPTCQTTNLFTND